jgi:DNA-binding transcriptional ArsR family regulator
VPLARGEQAVGDLAAATGQSFSLVSQQLALLRKAGLGRPAARPSRSIMRWRRCGWMMWRRRSGC